LTQETAIKALMNLKLSLGEAKAYLYLAINGPQKAKRRALELSQIGSLYGTKVRYHNFHFSFFLNFRN